MSSQEGHNNYNPGTVRAPDDASTTSRPAQEDDIESTDLMEDAPISGDPAVNWLLYRFRYDFETVLEESLQWFCHDTDTAQTVKFRCMDEVRIDLERQRRLDPRRFMNLRRTWWHWRTRLSWSPSPETSNAQGFFRPLTTVNGDIDNGPPSGFITMTTVALDAHPRPRTLYWYSASIGSYPCDDFGTIGSLWHVVATRDDPDAVLARISRTPQ